MPIVLFLHPIEDNVHNSVKKDKVNLNPSQMTKISKQQIQTPSVYLSMKNISLKMLKKLISNTSSEIEIGGSFGNKNFW
jgi:hypothetical protein